MNVFIGKNVTLNFQTAANKAATPPTYSTVSGECVAINDFCVVVKISSLLFLYQWGNDCIVNFSET